MVLGLSLREEDMLLDEASDEEAAGLDGGEEDEYDQRLLSLRMQERMQRTRAAGAELAAAPHARLPRRR